MPAQAGSDTAGGEALIDLRLACLEVLNDELRSTMEHEAAAAALRQILWRLPPDEDLVARLLSTSIRLRRSTFEASCLAEAVANMGKNRRQVEEGLHALIAMALEDGNAALAWDVLKAMLMTEPEPQPVDLPQIERIATRLLDVDDPRRVRSMIAFFDDVEAGVPDWMRTAVLRQPEVLDGLGDATLEHVHRHVPTSEGWLELAHRSSIRSRFAISADAFGDRLPQGLATLLEAAGTPDWRDDAVLVSWLGGWEARLKRESAAHAST